MSPSTAIVADVHLTRGSPPGVARDLAALLKRHPGERILFAGDLFDLSADQPRASRARAVKDVLASQPAVRAALSEHVDRGGELCILAGNHDAHLADTGVQRALIESLEAKGEVAGRVRFSPWFFRWGDLHVEHGHLYDPDNAPAHPLVLGERSLGVYFVEEFVAPTGAYVYLNRNDETPLRLFVTAFRTYGPHAAYIVYRYFATALSAMAGSATSAAITCERRLGQEIEAVFAETAGIDANVIRDLCGIAATPTLTSLHATYHRIYFDRVLATIALFGGGAAAIAGAHKAGLVSCALGALSLGASWAQSYDRYGGTVAQRLAESAIQVAEITRAKAVVFGHTHREDASGPYTNTGSFSFPEHDRGRPYLAVEGTDLQPRIVRRYAPRSI